MGLRFWPRAVLLRADVDEAKDLVRACSIKEAPAFVFFKGGRPVDRMQGACEMTLNVKICKALKHGAAKPRPHKWGEGLLKQRAKDAAAAGA